MAVKQNHDVRLKNVLLWCVSSLLIFSSIYHIGKGTSSLVAKGWPTDLHHRWAEHATSFVMVRIRSISIFAISPKGPLRLHGRSRETRQSIRSWADWWWSLILRGSTSWVR